MRKPEGWEEAQKTRYSLAAHGHSSSSTSPVRGSEPLPKTGTLTKKRRDTSGVTPLSSRVHNPASSSPLGDVDEPLEQEKERTSHFNVNVVPRRRTFASAKLKQEEDADVDESDPHSPNGGEAGPSGSSSQWRPTSVASSATSTSTTQNPSAPPSSKPISSSSNGTAKRKIGTQDYSSTAMANFGEGDSLFSFASNATAGVGDLRTVARRKKGAVPGLGSSSALTNAANAPTFILSDDEDASDDDGNGYGTGYGNGQRKGFASSPTADERDQDDDGSDGGDDDYVEYLANRPRASTKRRTSSLVGGVDR